MQTCGSRVSVAFMIVALFVPGVCAAEKSFNMRATWPVHHPAGTHENLDTTAVLLYNH